MNMPFQNIDLRLYRRSRGFTLIELMIVVAVIAILAAVALPAYFGSIRKSRRADAVTLISQAVQAQERWRANNPDYSSNLGGSGLSITSAATSLTTSGAAPNVVSFSEFDAPSGHYRLRLTTGSSTINNLERIGYTLRATAIGSQANDTPCASMTLTMSGGSIAYTSTGTATANQCWGR